MFAVVYVALRLLDDSRTGQHGGRCATTLAAEVMGMPANALKLDGVRVRCRDRGAHRHALAASLNGSVFPQDFEFPASIAVYTMVILGGAGSQAGVVLGAILVSVPRGAARAR